MPGLVSIWMGDCRHMGKPSRYVTSHPGQPSLAIPPWVGAMSTPQVGLNRAHCTTHYAYTMGRKQCATKLLSTSSPNVDPLEKIFHCHTLCTICNNMIVK